MDKSSALEYINQMFPNGNFNFTFIVFNYNRKVLLIDNRFLKFVTEASLSGVEPLMQKIQNEIRTVDAGILSAVRQQVFHFSD
jgi:vacuolar protein sorting-associated protein 53